MSDPATQVVVRLSTSSLDDIPLGVMRLSLDRTLVYMNRAASELTGPSVSVGSSLSDLELEPVSEQRLNAEIEERQRKQHGSSYTLTLQRADLGTQVVLSVSALPEFDREERLVGTVGLLTDMTMQRANLAVHEAIGEASDWQALLGALDEQLRRVLAFDAVLVSLVSADRTALRLFYERPLTLPGNVTTWRWWPMPAFVRADLDSLFTARADAVLEMFETSPYRELAATDEATKEWLELGYRHMLRRPVMHNGQLSAIVTLLREEDKAFTRCDIERIEQLPIGEAVNMALALDRQKELAFGLELIGRLGSAAGSISEVGRVLVDELRRHFEWEHVSLFRVDVDADQLCLVYQSGLDGHLLPPDYAQPASQGLLGHVARSGQPVRIGDVSLSEVYVQGIEGTRSEMCLPVPGEPVRWILNVEASQTGAFAQEEQATVSRLLEVAGLILDRTLALEFNATVLQSVADAIVLTSPQGEIQSVNPACEELLGRTKDALVGEHLSSFIKPPDDDPDTAGFAAHILGMDRLQPGEVHLLGQDGARIPALLSGASLPPQVGGKVYVASDLRFRQQVQRMDALQQVFRQVASETRLPISLAVDHLRELEEALEAGEVSGLALRELIQAAQRQLRRADLPLERVIRLAAAGEGQVLPLQPLRLAELAQRLRAELPQSQASQVLVAEDAAPPRHVLAARPELEFCAFSILAFLLRMKAQRDRICLRIAEDAAGQVLDAELRDERTGEPSATRLEARSEHEREFALAEPAIRSLMLRMRGNFEVRQKEGLVLRLRLTQEEAV